MKYFFEAQAGEEIRAVTLSAKNLVEGTRLFEAYLVGVNETCLMDYELTSATAYKRRGVTYKEILV